MIDHITFGVSNFALATEFYDKIFAPLKLERLVNITASTEDGTEVAGYGDTRPWFWIAATNPTQGKPHAAINVETRSLVDHFHTAAL
ncbi:MAG: catechol 2,3-dioxygenase-like lactoylglutathione lyase family enzyme [Candidatus Azotimanducaceae bacterium]